MNLKFAFSTPSKDFEIEWKTMNYFLHTFCILRQRLIGKSWIVFVQAIVLSFESIIVEFLTEIHGISSIFVAGLSIPIAGAMLLLVQKVLSDKKVMVFKSWKLLFSGSIFLAAAVFLWYDSVTRVG